ncbi:MAG: response regulator transcription factor [Verrucomicrobiota bacterium]
MLTLAEKSSGMEGLPTLKFGDAQSTSQLMQFIPASPDPDQPVAGGWRVAIELFGMRRVFALRADTYQAAVQEVRGLHAAILTRGWEAALQACVCMEHIESENASGGIQYWRQRLLLRRYGFAPSGNSEIDWAVKIDHAGMGFWFPLGAEDVEVAAKKAHQIYQTVVTEGWNRSFACFSRELVVSFEWNHDPVLWTYTTIHTLPDGLAGRPPVARSEFSSRRVIIVETEAGVRHALEWCVNQQGGFQAEFCEVPELLPQMVGVRKPFLVLINRNLAQRMGITLANGPLVMKSGVMALGYSVSADGDQMFVSTPGGAESYMLKRVKPTAIFDLVSQVARLSNPCREDLLGAAKSYFKESLRSRPEGELKTLARLTPRENDVLALLSKGCVAKEIAQNLNISVWTVHDHIKKIFERLHVRTRTEAVVRYLEK